MSVGSRMHPRNIYRQNPNYTELALQYPEFMRVARLDINGKIKLDFKDANTLRILTRCLLHKDFGLSVEIPADRLVPTLPLRLNYILWIEDLLQHGNCEQKHGIDIGTGACAIYALLAATKNKWKMIATENDKVNIDAAQKNIQANNLQSLITLVRDNGESLLAHCFDSDTSLEVDFCVCNPPFFSSVEDIGKARSPSRAAPRNAHTGSLQELITEGGEVAFISKLIAESKKITTKVRIYTTMLGHKTSLKSLMRILKDNGIDNFTHTEFCQGRTTRWGLAWTFSNLYDLKCTAPKPKQKSNDNRLMLIIPQSSDISYKVIPVANKMLKILDEIAVDYKYLQRKENKVSLRLSAKSNTWSNQRRKRRLLKALESSKKTYVANGDGENDTQARCPIGNGQVKNVDKNSNDVLSSCHKVDVDSRVEENVSIVQQQSSLIHSNGAVETKEAFLEGEMTVVQEESSIILEMSYLNGPAGKDGIHQILQYIKNNFA